MSDSGVDKVVGSIDGVVPTADSAVAQMTPSEERAVARVGVIFAVCSVLLVPWTVYLAYDLPRRARTDHYNLAWVGFDAMLVIALVALAWTALRRSDWLPVAGAWSAALLITDAWFDVMTSSQREVATAVLMALLVELPLAAVSVWLCRHATLVQRRQHRWTRRGRVAP
ncbi:MAG: hypothetical protein U0R78_02670 [Nocardioidaceae bacterium]